MNIKYIGATENSDYWRYAVIQYAKKEEEKAKRFVLLFNELAYRNTFEEEEMIYIRVNDKEDYEYVKDCFKAYKNTKVFNKTPKYDCFSYQSMYESAEFDSDMYCYLVNEGLSESAIKVIMLSVSGANDAYNNALTLLSTEIF